MVEELERILKDHKVPSFYFSGEEKDGERIVYVGNDTAGSLFKKKRIPGITVITDSEKYKEHYFGPKEVLGEKALEKISSEIKLYSSAFSNSKICYPDMTDDNFVVHSGNRGAVNLINSAFEDFLGGAYCRPICIVGPSGSGKTALLSNALLKGLDKVGSSFYLNINTLRSELNAKGGAKKIDLSHFFGAKAVVIDSLEEVPSANNSTWIRNDVVYRSLDRGFGNGSLQFLAFMGDSRDYYSFSDSMPHDALRNRLMERVKLVELRHPEKRDYKKIIEDTLKSSLVAPKDKVKFGEVVSYFNSIIPDGSSLYSIKYGHVQEALDVAAKKKEEIGIPEIKASLSYQPSLFNPNSIGPREKFDNSVRKWGYNAESLIHGGRTDRLVEMRDNVIGDLWEDGIRVSEIARLLNKKSHVTIISRLKKMKLYH
jgi:DNA replication protein DnaC